MRSFPANAQMMHKYQQRDLCCVPLLSGAGAGALVLPCRYYTGRLAAYDEDFTKAKDDLTYAFENCDPRAKENRRKVLRYLIPVRCRVRGCSVNDIPVPHAIKVQCRVNSSCSSAYLLLLRCSVLHRHTYTDLHAWLPYASCIRYAQTMRCLLHFHRPPHLRTTHQQKPHYQTRSGSGLG